MLAYVECRIDSIMNCDLTKPFREEEILTDLQQIHPHKALGPDGLSGAFYRNH